MNCENLISVDLFSDGHSIWKIAVWNIKKKKEARRKGWDVIDLNEDCLILCGGLMNKHRGVKGWVSL